MNWKLKASFQRFASNIPFGIDLYIIGQRLIGGLKEFRVDTRLAFVLELIDCLVDQGESLSGKRALEIGTGWAPVLPVFFWLYGLTECHTFDTHRLLKPTFVKQTILGLNEYYSRNEKIIAQWKNRDIYQENKHLPILRDLIGYNVSSESILEECGITYHAPADASSTGLPNGSIDIVFSNLVLNEIPIGSLETIFSEAYRVLRPSGMMFHLIDLSDQFVYGQQEITTINFLQYSEKEFSKYNSPLLYQNRLRSPHYRKLFEKPGFKIVYWRTRVDSNALKRLSSIKIHPDFSSFSSEELCTNAIYVLAKKETI